MNRLFRAMVCTTALSLYGVSAMAVDYPSKPITIVVPYAAGGTTDMLSRLIAQKLSTEFKQPVVVDNKPGASEQITATFVKRAPADGHTIGLLTMTGMSVNPGLYGAKLPYDPIKDFKPIIHAVSIPSVIVVNPSIPVKTLSELTAYIKANPADANYASAGSGTPAHLGIELYKRIAKINATHVPYKGGAPGLQALMASQVSMMMALAPEAMPYAKAGKLKALALTAPTRSPLYPDLPTTSEAGVKDLEILQWFAYLAPSGTPDEIVRKLNASINAVLRDAEVSAKLAELGMDASGGAPSRLTDIARQDAAKWTKLIQEAGISID